MANVGIINGIERAGNGPHYTQVYEVTHTGADRRPFMKRSFISFSFGERPDGEGKTTPVYIEDFNLIATVSGDRWERNAYADFEDLTSTYDVIHGQFYWGTYFHSFPLSFLLSTDGMTLRLLDDFKLWFRAGLIKELILSEHPNRAALARVASPPHFNLLPFEHKVEIPISVTTGEDNDPVITRNYKTSTTLYKGDIDLELVLDEPFWYAKKNLLGQLSTLDGSYDEQWIDANGQTTSVRDNPDALKVIYEDRIPLGSMTKISVFLGGDTYAKVLYEAYSLIATPLTETEYNAVMNDSKISQELKDSAYFEDEELNKFPKEDGTGYYQYYYGAVIAANDSDTSRARIAGAQYSSAEATISGVDLPVNETANLYYAGNAPSPVKLRFTLIPQIGSNEQAYMIITPRNKYAYDEKPYNTIQLTSVTPHDFDFTIPTLYASYNLVIKILSDENIMAPGNAWLMVRETIRDTIRHPVVRAWANKMIDKYDNDYGSGIIGNLGTAASGLISLDTILSDLKDGMSLLFRAPLEGSEPRTIDDNLCFRATFTFDGKTGKAIGEFTTWDPSTLTITPLTRNGGEFLDIKLRNQISAQIGSDGGLQTKNFVENVGDMVRGSYLILDERNNLDENFQVLAWSEAHPDYAYLIKHDVSDSLLDLHFEFKNMYL